MVKMEEYEKEIKMIDGFDNDSGIKSPSIKFILKKDNHGVTFEIGTGWSPGENPDIEPIFFGLALHSPKPLYEGHTKSTKNCSITNGDCYCDGTSLLGDVFDEFMRTGKQDIIWQEMKDWYESRWDE